MEKNRASIFFRTLFLPFRFLMNFIKRVQHFIELSGYNESTICEYFRKQGAQIGEECYIFTNKIGTEPYLVKIGNRVAIAEGVAFMTHDGGAWIFRKEIPNMQVFGTIEIGDNCVIGERSVLFPNIRIGENSIVGAGSVVISDVPPNTLVMGVPARPFGSVEKYKEKCISRWKEQMPPDCLIEEGATWWNSSHFSENREKLKRHLIKLFSEKKINPPETNSGTGDQKQ
jgi:acetyltransferase-like isoleucine patch superfamily enzyme